MVTPLSVAGATARALAPLEVAELVTEGLLVLTDFPDCLSRLLGFADGFDATTAFFVAAAVLTGAFAGVGFAAGLTALLAGLFATFFTATGARFAFATDFDGALCALAAPARATVLLRAGAFA
ncbi:MAG TPA: hypothetical protein VGO25_04865 [Rhodanobacteraceae bacterium]|nr:hypothetical protein [Rhodanobacteraceae bacterium]